jgi:transglutaminase-like putative cysteine protease
MARRLGWLSGIAALGLALARLTRLLQPQVEGPPWPLVLTAAAVLGATFAWAARSYRLAPIPTVALHVAGALVAVLRITAPTTLRLGVVPSGETLELVRAELSFAWEIIRYGAAPVLPVAGLVAVLAVVFWALGALAVEGAARRIPLLVGLPGIVFYLQLATLDRRAPGHGWLIALGVVGAVVLVSLGRFDDPTAGRVRARSGMLLPRTSRAIPLVTAIVAITGSVYASSALAATVPEAGVLQWRSQSGIGSGLYGGSSFNLFVGLQQSLISLSDDPLFYATVSESAPPNRELFWRLITLDTFDGTNWIPSAQSFARQGDSRWERPDLAFQGPTVPVAARVRLAGLAQQLLPVLYSPFSLQSDVELIRESFRVREDGSIGIDLRSREGWEYEFQSNVPQPDIAQLASLGGDLSPIFEEAAGEGVFNAPARPPVFLDRPTDIEDYLELPEDTDVAVRNLARDITADGTTRFEKALILESWLRDPREFTYSSEVSTGHSSLDLADWLLDPESRNYRTGYCEQFATAMAVMARTLGLPSRIVLGFTPGDVQAQSDGSDVIVVRERNAHAWVELWMDGQGWVRFDPTPRSDGANQSLSVTSVGFDPRDYIPQPDEPDGAQNPGGSPGEREPLLPEIDVTAGDSTPDFRPGSGFGLPVWAWWMVALMALSGSVPGFKLVRRRRRLSRIRTGDVTAAWEEIIDRLRDLGERIEPSQTPLEIAASTHVDLLPLATMYTAATYGGSPRGDGRIAFDAAESRIEHRYQRSHRALAWMMPASLRRG